MFLATFAFLLTCMPLPQQEANTLPLLRTFRREFVHIRPGQNPFPRSFVMGPAKSGDRQTAHRVTFDYTFFVSKYEVTQELWQAVMGSNPSRWQGRRNSVEMLSFSEAQTFCERITKQLREAKLIDQKQEVRLPSEAEWEYCARADTQTKYSFGDNVALLDTYAWSTQNAAGNDPAVGEKKPNPWGLYDIHGYLWEWCLDDGLPAYEGAPTDGQPHVKQPALKQGVLRGGSWKDAASLLETRYRRIASRDLRDDAVGLRCVLASVRPQRAQDTP